MAIVLSEIRTAVQTYLNTKVSTTISAVSPDGPATLNPGEEGSFSLSVSNAIALAGGIRLTNVRYRLTTNNAALLKLKVPPAATVVTRSGVSSGSPILAPGTLVSEMFLFPTDSSLDVGDIDNLAGLKVKAIALGNPSITCRIHADADLNHLFPKDEDSAVVNKVVSIV